METGVTAPGIACIDVFEIFYLCERVICRDDEIDYISFGQ